MRLVISTALVAIFAAIVFAMPAQAQDAEPEWWMQKGRQCEPLVWEEWTETNDYAGRESSAHVYDRVHEVERGIMHYYEHYDSRVNEVLAFKDQSVNPTGCGEFDAWNFYVCGTQPHNFPGQAHGWIPTDDIPYELKYSTGLDVCYNEAYWYEAIGQQCFDPVWADGDGNPDNNPAMWSSPYERSPEIEQAMEEFFLFSSVEIFDTVAYKDDQPHPSGCYEDDGAHYWVCAIPRSPDRPLFLDSWRFQMSFEGPTEAKGVSKTACPIYGGSNGNGDGSGGSGDTGDGSDSSDGSSDDTGDSGDGSDSGDSGDGSSDDTGDGGSGSGGSGDGSDSGESGGGSGGGSGDGGSGGGGSGGSGGGGSGGSSQPDNGYSDYEQPDSDDSEESGEEESGAEESGHDNQASAPDSDGSSQQPQSSESAPTFTVSQEVAALFAAGQVDAHVTLRSGAKPVLDGQTTATLRSDGLALQVQGGLLVLELERDAIGRVEDYQILLNGQPLQQASDPDAQGFMMYVSAEANQLVIRGPAEPYMLELSSSLVVVKTTLASLPAFVAGSALAGVGVAAMTFIRRVTC